MPSCHKCQKRTIFHDDFCKACFCEVLERRIKKYLGQRELIQRNDVLYVTDDLVEYFLKNLITLPITIVRTLKTNVKPTKRVLAWTMDHELEYFLDQLVNKGTIPTKEKSGIKFFLAVTKAELEAYAQAKKLDLSEDLKPEPAKELTKPSGLVGIPGSGGDFVQLNTIQTPADILNELEKRHKETRHSLMKSVEQLKMIMKENKTV